MNTYPTARTNIVEVDGVRMAIFGSYQTRAGWIVISVGKWEDDVPSMDIVVPVFWYDHSRKPWKTTQGTIVKIFEEEKDQ